MYVNCGSWNARCTVYKVEIISLAFKWLIVLRSAIKTRDQTHVYASSAQAGSITILLLSRGKLLYVGQRNRAVKGDCGQSLSS